LNANTLKCETDLTLGQRLVKAFDLNEVPTFGLIVLHGDLLSVFQLTALLLASIFAAVTEGQA
jgi:hypothetical protein